VGFGSFGQAFVGHALRVAVFNTATEAVALQFSTQPPCRLRILDGYMIRKLKSGKYRLYSRKKNSKTGKRRNLGTFKTKAAAKKHEKAVQYFKRH
jgi:hypothetical protein